MPQPHMASRTRKWEVERLWREAARTPRSRAVRLSWRKKESPTSNSMPLSVRQLGFVEIRWEEFGGFDGGRERKGVRGLDGMLNMAGISV